MKASSTENFELRARPSQATARSEWESLDE
jgi:hypothetical protein